MLHTTNFPYEVVGNDSTYFLNKVTLFCDVFTRVLFTRAFSFVNNCVFPCGRVSPMSGVLVLAIVHFCDRVSLCRVGFANGNHSGSQLATISRRPTSKNGYILVTTPEVTLEKILLRQFLRLMSRRWYVVRKTKIAPSGTNNLLMHHQHRDHWGSLMRLPGNYLDPRARHPCGREQRHHCLLQNVGTIFYSPEAAQSFSRTSGAAVSQ